jgi:hypothetical protein
MAANSVAPPDQADVTDWTLEVLVPLIIMLILFIGSIVLTSKTGGWEYSKKDVPAFEAYARYSQELDSICDRYAKELKVD